MRRRIDDRTWVTGARRGTAVRRHAAGIVLAAMLSACAAVPPPTQRDPAPEGPPLSEFAASLEALALREDLPAEGKVILVNVPAFELVALDDREPVLRSRVIVGSVGTRTPLIDTFTTAVRFRPTWRPTPSMIASGEYEDYTRPPGRNNPLGLAAVRLEPGLLVYLHDTNRRDLFEREQRAMSHGCIRVERWDEVIAWLLDIDLDEVHRRANGGRTVDVPLPSIPILIRYYRAFPDDTGQIVQFDDVYQLEAGAPLPRGSQTRAAVLAGNEPCSVG